MYTPILILGDPYIGQKYIVKIKKELPNADFYSHSVSDGNFNEIRALVGRFSLIDKEKLIVLSDIPNNKKARKFLSELLSVKYDDTYIVIFDSKYVIKSNSYGSYTKEWKEFIDAVKKIKGSKVIESNPPFDEKKKEQVYDFVANKFQKNNKKISRSNVVLFTDIIGYDRGLLDSEIRKFCFAGPEVIEDDFILRNTFPSSKESLVYKIDSAVDSYDYARSIEIVEKFLSSGFDANVVADRMLKKSRNAMAAVCLWANNFSWEQVAHKLLQMGKIPSGIWDNDKLTQSQKNNMSKDVKDLTKYLVDIEGTPDKYIRHNHKQNKSVDITSPFVAKMTVDYVKTAIRWNDQGDNPYFKKQVSEIYMKKYLFINKKTCDIRAGKNPIQDVYEILKVMTSRNFLGQ